MTSLRVSAPDRLAAQQHAVMRSLMIRGGGTTGVIGADRRATAIETARATPLCGSPRVRGP